MDDHTSLVAQLPATGGQLMTGRAVLPAMTGPNPLLRPATAMITVGTPSPSYRRTNEIVSWGHFGAEKAKGRPLVGSSAFV